VSESAKRWTHHELHADVLNAKRFGTRIVQAYDQETGSTVFFAEVINPGRIPGHGYAASPRRRRRYMAADEARLASRQPPRRVRNRLEHLVLDLAADVASKKWLTAEQAEEFEVLWRASSELDRRRASFMFRRTVRDLRLRLAHWTGRRSAYMTAVLIARRFYGSAWARFIAELRLLAELVDPGRTTRDWADRRGPPSPVRITALPHVTNAPPVRAFNDVIDAGRLRAA
jgi:hypothetical protein